MKIQYNKLESGKQYITVTRQSLTCCNVMQLNAERRAVLCETRAGPKAHALAEEACWERQTECKLQYVNMAAHYVTIYDTRMIHQHITQFNQNAHMCVLVYIVQWS